MFGIRCEGARLVIHVRESHFGVTLALCGVIGLQVW